MSDMIEKVAEALRNLMCDKCAGDGCDYCYGTGEPSETERAQAAIQAHTAVLIEGAGDVTRQLIAGDLCDVELAPKAAATIAALQAELARVKEEGVRLGIEAAARACEADPEYDGEDYGPGLDQAIKLCRTLDPAVIARRDTALSELAEHDAVLLDGGDDGQQ